VRTDLRAAALCALLVLALAGCTAGSRSETPAGPQVPPESSFAEGTCRIAAPDVRAVGQALPRLGDQKVVDAEVQAELLEAQQRVRALAEGAEPAVKPALDDLVVKIGLVRIRAAGNSYETALGESLTRSYEQVLDVCTRDAPAG
jgi:hypothetical protein